MHDLHVWTITSGMESMSAHVVVSGERPGWEVLSEVRETIHERIGIEPAGGPASAAPSVPASGANPPTSVFLERYTPPPRV